jgi:predicted Zn finger-like uncharacterized protein
MYRFAKTLQKNTKPIRLSRLENNPMLITCPSCSARYKLSSEALGPLGRDVKCKKCGHVWFARPSDDQDSKNPADSQISQNQDPIISESAWGEVRDNKVAEKVSVSSSDTPSQKSTPITKSKPATKPAHTIKEASEGQKKLASILVAAAIFSVLAFFANSFFSHEQAPVESPLIFERISVSRDGSSVQGSAQLINLSREPQLISQILIELKDEKNQVLHQEIIVDQELTIPAESVEDIAFQIQKVPEQAKNLTLKAKP